MLDVIVGFAVGVGTTLVLIKMYIRGKLIERWYLSGRRVTQEDGLSGYEVLLKKGKDEMVIYRVLFDRKSSPNPDTSFADQLTQARADAAQRAEVLNIHEHRSRDINRKDGMPGGIV